jgi:hypothetical protein
MNIKDKRKNLVKISKKMKNTQRTTKPKSKKKISIWDDTLEKFLDYIVHPAIKTLGSFVPGWIKTAVEGVITFVGNLFSPKIETSEMRREIENLDEEIEENRNVGWD